MIYCINPKCQHRQNEDEQEFCSNCGTPLLIKNRYRLIQPLRSLEIEHHTEIWQADDGGIRKVIKILHTDKPKLLALLEREAEALQKLNHPGIPQAEKDSSFTITPHHSAEKLHCLVIEYIEGKNLEDLVEKSGKISQYQALDWLRQILDILDYIHKNGYFHRDIKPSNIILKPNGKLSLIDFGAVRLIRSSFLVKSRLALADGSLADFLKITKIVSEGFTAPEQVEGKALPQSDFYALGRTFVYLVTGIHPLHLYSPHTNKLIWRQEARQISLPLVELIDDLMNPSPASRPQNPQAIAQRLTKWSLWWREWLSWKGLAWSCLLIINFGLFWQLGSRAMARHYFGLAQKHSPQEKLEEKIKDLEKAVNLNPYNSTYQEELAQANFKLGTYLLVNGEQLSQARQKFEQAIQLNPQKALFHSNLGLTCQEEKDFQCAINSYQQALKLASTEEETAIIHYNLGGIYEQIGNIDAANQEYLIVMSINSTKPEMSIRAANNYSRLRILYDSDNSLSLEILQNSFNKLQELLNNSEKQSKQPDEQLLILKSTLLKNIGWIHLQKGELQQAQKVLQKAIESEPKALKIAPDLIKKRADSHCLLAQVLQYLQEEKALASWVKCRDYQNKSDLPEVRIWQLRAQQYLKLKGVEL